MFLATKAMDTTRPVLDTSGYSHRVPEADVYDSHDYSQDPDQLAQHQAGLAAGNPYRNSAASWGMPARTAARLVGSLEWSIAYRGQPYFVSEFGGIWWNPELAGRGVVGLRRPPGQHRGVPTGSTCAPYLATPACSATAPPGSPTPWSGPPPSSAPPPSAAPPRRLPRAGGSRLQPASRPPVLDAGERPR